MILFISKYLFYIPSLILLERSFVISHQNNHKKNHILSMVPFLLHLEFFDHFLPGIIANLMVAAKLPTNRRLGSVIPR